MASPGSSEATIDVSDVAGDDEYGWRPRAANAEQRFPTRFSSSPLPPPHPLAVHRPLDARNTSEGPQEASHSPQEAVYDSLARSRRASSLLGCQRTLASRRPPHSANASRALAYTSKEVRGTMGSSVTRAVRPRDARQCEVSTIAHPALLTLFFIS